MFFTYYQNNVDGKFIKNDNLIEYVIVEADNNIHADHIANSVGIDFNERDCYSSRWTRTEYRGSDSPRIYGQPISEYESYYSTHCVVYYLDGTKQLCPLKS